MGTLIRDLFFGSSQWSGFCAVRIEPDVSPLSTEGLHFGGVEGLRGLGFRG